MTEITENLYLGDVDDSRNTNLIFGKGIALIINCTNHEKHYLKTARHPYRLRYVKVLVNDDLTNRSIKAMNDQLNNATQAIHEELVQNHKVLVHCHRGVQRSACVVTAYLMKYHKMILSDAITWVKVKRPCVFWPGNNFIESLLHFEKGQMSACNAAGESDHAVADDIS